MQSGFWKADWFLAVAVVVLFALFNAASDLVPSLENKAYDLGMQAANRAPSERIAVIAIDDTSIANIGRWPWPRDVHARMTDLLAGAKAKVIGNTLFFSEAQVDPGYATIVKLIELAEKPSAEGAPGPSAELAGFLAALKDAEQRSGLDVARGKKLCGCDFFPIAELGAQHLDAAALGRDLEGLLRRFNDFADFSLDRAEGADGQLARVEDL